MISAVVPISSLVDPRASDGEKALDVGLEMAGLFLPGVKLIKYGDEAASVAVKFSDEVVEFVQGSSDTGKKILANLPEGFSKINQRSPHGAPIYTNGKSYISPDKDGHLSGAVWKGAKKVEDLFSKGTRSGTYDAQMKRIGN